MAQQWPSNGPAKGIDRGAALMSVCGSDLGIGARKGGEENGAGDEIRTHDINLGKVALYP